MVLHFKMIINLNYILKEGEKKKKRMLYKSFSSFSLKYHSSGDGGMTGCIDYSVKLLKKQCFITIILKCLILENCTYTTLLEIFTYLQYGLRLQK